MKRSISFFVILFLFALTLHAQPRPVTDRGVIDALRTDFDKRNSLTPDVDVNWFSSEYGYYGLYSIDQKTYMTRYDKDVNYLETFVRKEWDENVPSSIRNSFNKSPYQDQHVTGYWEVIDLGRNGCCLELMSSDGKSSRIWGDDKGRFSTEPYATNISN
ncbi:MAG TPA: hypothetical protein VIM65_18840 [Cyclobacteriaceae bacterium]